MEREWCLASGQSGVYYSSCSAQPGPHEACMCKCCPGCVATATLLLEISTCMIYIQQCNTNYRALYERFIIICLLLRNFQQLEHMPRTA